MNNRIKELRKSLNMTQDEFADRLGLARNSIASYESGRRSPNDAMLKLISRTFNTDYFWLTEGRGEMFKSFPDALIDRLAKECNIDEFGMSIMKAYSIMKPEQKQSLKDFLLSIAENIKNGEN